MVLVCDLDGTIRYASQAVEDYGYAPGALVRPAAPRFRPPRGPGRRPGARPGSRSAATSPRGSAESPKRPRSRARPRDQAGSRPGCAAADGTWRHVESTVLRYQAPGEPTQILVTARDVSDQVALRQQVTHLTFHDGLTGLPNRAYVEERAGTCCATAGRQADRRHLPRPGPLHRGQRLGRPRRGRPGARPGGPAAARRRPGPRHGGPLGQRRVRRPDRERRGAAGGHRDRRTAGRRGRGGAVPGGRPADRAHRERRRRPDRPGPREHRPR